jgi:hypothetical protein
MKLLLLAFAVLFTQGASAYVSGQVLAAALPRQLAAAREGADLHTPRTVSVIVSSRRTDDPPLPVRAEKLQAQLKRSLAKTPFTPVDDSSRAQLNMELVIESHKHWKDPHVQTGPYVFLLLRDHANARVLYCGYRRVGLFYERAVDDLAKDFLRTTGAGTPAAIDDVRGCAKEAMRLSDVGL